MIPRLITTSEIVVDVGDINPPGVDYVGSPAQQHMRDLLDDAMSGEGAWGFLVQAPNGDWCLFGGSNALALVAASTYGSRALVVEGRFGDAADFPQRAAAAQAREALAAIPRTALTLKPWEGALIAALGRAAEVLEERDDIDVGWADALDANAENHANQLDAAINLVYPDDMTPAGKRVLDSIVEQWRRD